MHRTNETPARGDRRAGPQQGPVLLGAVFAVALFLGQAAGAGAAEAPFQSDSLYNRGVAKPILVHHFEVGVVIARGADSLGISLADTLSLRAPQRFTEGVMVFAMDDTLARDSLVARIRRIRNQGIGRFLRVGMVISKSPASEPMIVTDQIVVRLKNSVSPNHIDSLLAKYGLTLNRENPFQARVRRYDLPDTSSYDAISLCRRLSRNRFVDYAFPNLLHVIHSLSGPTDEVRYPRQWHLENTGLSGGTPDADIDAASAWAITQGSDAVIAVIDGGFDLTHEDLKANLWVNPVEIACNGIDEDGSYMDDVNGWDFYDCDYGCGSLAAGTPCYACDFDPSKGGDCSAHKDATRCGDLELKCMVPIDIDIHGTAVAGIAAARGDNGAGTDTASDGKGMTGIAPLAKLMLLRRAIDGANLAEAFDYAANKGAWVINCSWRLTPDQVLEPVLEDAIIGASERGRNGKGCVIVFAMSNAGTDDCGGTTDNDLIYLLKRTDGRDAVIAVSGSTNQDAKAANTGIGDCADVLAPTYGGTLYVATADHRGSDGYNTAIPLPCPTPAPGVDKECPDDDFTYCFTGTSAAAPMVSGAAALVLSANPDLTASEVQRLLQDTADKIEDVGTTSAKYSTTTGYSDGAAGVPTHGWGRLNAYEAVRVAALPDATGRDGRDIFLRDHGLDWGNTEQPSTVLPGPAPAYRRYWECIDIKVDAGPTWQPAPTTSAEFDAMTEENPMPGIDNRIYVRVRNRGPLKAGEVVVKLHWAYCATTLPPLPGDFWERFPEDASVTTQWHPLVRATLTDVVYSGASSTKAPESDGARFAMITFPAPALDPAYPTHLCLFGVLHSEQDRCNPARKVAESRTLDPEDFIVDWLTPRDNNIGQQNVQLVNVGSGGEFAQSFYVRNAAAFDGPYRLLISKIHGWRITIHPKRFNGKFRLKAGEERLVTIRGMGTKDAKPATLEITQVRATKESTEPVGGVTLRLSRRP